MDNFRNRYSAGVPRTGPKTRIRVQAINKESAQRSPGRGCSIGVACPALQEVSMDKWVSPRPRQDRSLCSSAPAAAQELDIKLPTLPTPRRESEAALVLWFHRESRVRWRAPQPLGRIQHFRVENVPDGGK